MTTLRKEQLYAVSFSHGSKTREDMHAIRENCKNCWNIDDYTLYWNVRRSTDK